MYLKMENKTFYNFIVQGLKSLGYEPLPTVAEFFIFYAHELKRWNKVHNLTSITDEKDIAVRHKVENIVVLRNLYSILISNFANKFSFN